MKINNHEVTVITYCPFCGRAHEIECNEMDYLDWQDGALVQDAFPYLNLGEREMLISGICPTCWDQTFGGNEHLETMIEQDILDEEYFDDLLDFLDDEGFSIEII